MTINELYNLPYPDYFFNPYSNEVFDVKGNEILPKFFSTREFDALVRPNPSQLFTYQFPDDEVSFTLESSNPSNHNLVSEFGYAKSVLQVQERSESVPEPASFLLLSFSLVAFLKRFRK